MVSYSELTPEQKKRRNKSNAASHARYEAKAYDKALLRIRSDGADGVTLDQLREQAQRDGLSLNAWILRAIRDEIERANSD